MVEQRGDVMGWNKGVRWSGGVVEQEGDVVWWNKGVRWCGGTRGWCGVAKVCLPKRLNPLCDSMSMFGL